MSEQAAEFNAFLWQIADTTDRIGSRLDALATVFSGLEFDRSCQTIGAALCNVQAPSSYDDHAVFLVTGLAGSGGHTRVVRDLMDAYPTAKRTVIVSRLHDWEHQDGFEHVFDGLDVQFELAPSGTDLVAKLVWIQALLARLRPSRGFMLIHGFDAVMTAALQPGLVERLYFIHNVDHSICLGLHLPHAIHVDLHAKGYWHCKEVEGVPHVEIAPVTAADLGHRLDRPFLARGKLTSATCGGFEKFSLARFNSPVTYRYDYADGLAVLLAAGGGTHIHYGPLPDEILQRIAANLLSLGIGADRFQMRPYVPSVWRAFLADQVDLYLGSFPLGGGRATVEALGAGLPLLIHSNYWSNFLSVECEVYEGAMIWRSFEELTAHVRALTSETLRRHALLARAYYDRVHHPSRLRMAFARMEAGTPCEVDRPLYQPDLLRRHIDFHQD